MSRHWHELLDTEGRRWSVLRSLSHDEEQALLVQRTSGARHRVGTCRIRFRVEVREVIAREDEVATHVSTAHGRICYSHHPYGEIVSQGRGRVEEEEYDDGRIRTTRAPPRGEVVGRLDEDQVMLARNWRLDLLHGIVAQEDR